MASAAHELLKRGRAIVPVLFVLLVSFLLAQSARNDEDWANSPQAYFLTKEELAEWKTLDSRDSRQRFIERYWLKRDPSPGTERNEFREMVLARIEAADQRFGIGKTPGSRTARGLVSIVLGTPARVQSQVAPLPPAVGPRRSGMGVTPVAVFEGNDTTTTWFYEPDRTPRILQLVRRPSVQIKIVVEPSRRSDAIQDPGLFNELKEIVARASITNPDFVPAGSGSMVVSGALDLPRQTLSAEIRRLLESAPATARDAGSFVGSAVVFRQAGNPETLFWIFSPTASRHLQFEALVRDGEGREIATLMEPARISSAFSTLSSGAVASRSLSLPPGSYRASLALTGDGEKKLALAELPVEVPSLDKGFAVSSVILTRGPAPATADAFFTFGGATLPPRADAAFTSSESLWYFVEIANPSDPTRVFLEPRLRRSGQPMAGLPSFPANLQPLGSGRYLVGVELPLSSLSAGDYVLYLSVSDGNGQGAARVLRRADFQVARGTAAP